MAPTQATTLSSVDDPVQVLFTPVALGGKNNRIQLKHRIFMPPLTRLRWGEDGVPTELTAAYYGLRATDGGLLIAEATNISPTARGYFGAPGIFTDAQVEGWKKVLHAVHDKGGKMFLQLWHTGRVGHPLNQPGGVLPVSSSATSMQGVPKHAVTREGRHNYVTPRALDASEIPLIVEDYKRAAANAFAAGFDGVELHSANGYLLEQFLCDNTNFRADEYGGSVENRARFLFQALEAILSVAPTSSRVGIRLSPFGVTFGCTDSNPRETYGYVINKLNDYDLAYLHVVEPFGWEVTGPLVPKGGISPAFRPIYKGVLISAGGFTRDRAIEFVSNGHDDLVGFGRDFIGTPDLVKRIRINAPFNKYDSSTFYPEVGTPPEPGYIDYPLLGDQ